MIAAEELEPTSRIDVLEDELWSAEHELTALVEALERAPRVDSVSGMILLASGARMVDEVGDAARVRAELVTLRLAVKRQRTHVARLRSERRRLGDRWPMGLIEVGVELGYPAATVKQWRNRGLMPAPAGEVSGHPFWWRPDVMLWAKATGRDRKVPGRVVCNVWAMAGDRGAWDR